MSVAIPNISLGNEPHTTENKPDAGRPSLSRGNSGNVASQTGSNRPGQTQPLGGDQSRTSSGLNEFQKKEERPVQGLQQSYSELASQEQRDREGDKASGNLQGQQGQQGQQDRDKTPPPSEGAVYLGRPHESAGQSVSAQSKQSGQSGYSGHSDKPSGLQGIQTSETPEHIKNRFSEGDARACAAGEFVAPGPRDEDQGSKTDDQDHNVSKPSTGGFGVTGAGHHNAPGSQTAIDTAEPNKPGHATDRPHEDIRRHEQDTRWRDAPAQKAKEKAEYNVHGREGPIDKAQDKMGDETRRHEPGQGVHEDVRRHERDTRWRDAPAQKAKEKAEYNVHGREGPIDKARDKMGGETRKHEPGQGVHEPRPHDIDNKAEQAGTNVKPSLGDKVKGTLESMKGKLQKDPVAQEQGKIRRKEGAQGLEDA